MKLTFLILAFLTCLMSVNAFAGIFGYENFEDCVIERSKGQEAPAVIARVHDFCRKKFPPSPELPGLAAGIPSDVLCMPISNSWNRPRPIAAYFAPEQKVATFLGRPLTFVDLNDDGISYWTIQGKGSLIDVQLNPQTGFLSFEPRVPMSFSQTLRCKELLEQEQ